MNPMSAVREFFHLVTYPVRMLARLPASIISTPGRFMGLTLPTRVAFVMAISLLLVSVLYFVLKWLQPGRSDPWLFDALIVLVLIILAAIVARMVVKTWLEKGFSRFPEIDQAWEAGVAALRARGIDILDTPVVLVLGAGSKPDVDALMRATGLTWSVDGEPLESSWLHWYANSDIIYLVCTQTCVLGALKGRLSASGDQLDHGSDLIRQTINPSVAVRGTADATIRKARPEGTNADPWTVPDTSSVRGTLQLASVSGPGMSPARSGSSVTLSMEEAVEYTARLEYLCHRLRHERQPVCPGNGILALLPVEIIKRGEAEGVEVQRAAKVDLETIRQTLALRCPVVALVSGLESEPGFRELVRRVGRERAKHQRFGHRFGVWNPPIPDQVQALAARACQAFETFAYTLFQERDGLTQYGNRKLYSLLCCVRSTLRTRLTNILVGSLADDTSEPYGSGHALLLSGCYFAATGDTEDRQAFVKAVVVDRFVKEDLVGALEWCQGALDEDRRFHALAQVGLVIDGLLFLAAAALGVALFYKW